MTDREELETLAMAEVCACRYYDLADCLESAPDYELIDVIEHTTKCEICGQ